MKARTIGIIGGGQLGRMICFSAHKMGFSTVILTDQKNSPASEVSNKTIIADYLDKNALKEFCNLVDFATFEFENIPLKTVEFIGSKINLYPNSTILKITQNRILEKNFLKKNNIKTTEFKEIKNFKTLEETLKTFKKAILKTALMGYDGKGQYVLTNVDQAKESWINLKNQSLILEKFCQFDCEISVIVARSISEEMSVYEPLLNIHKDGILRQSHYPAKIDKSLKLKAMDIAKKIATKLNLVGVLAVEFFVVDNQLMVNELAPRPHNSGHFSMDACLTSQFDQLIRAIADYKLGIANFHSCGYMQNIIGKDINNISKYYKNAKAKVHLYGKKEAKDGRKMGHINIITKTN